MIVAEKRLKTDSRVQVTVGVAFERSTTNGRIGTSVTAMGVNNPDRSPLGIHGRDAAPSNRPALSRARALRVQDSGRHGSASRELHSVYLPLHSGVAYLCLVRQMQPWTKASCDAGEASTKAQR